MWRALPIMALLLLLGDPGLAEGSFNRVSTPQEPEAPTAVPESAEVAPASAEAAVPAAPAPEAEAAPDVEPPRGNACIYGPQGLIFQPRGKQCAEAVPGPASPDRAPGGRCIMGTRGQVLYAPPGVSCEDTLQ